VARIFGNGIGIVEIVGEEELGAKGAGLDDPL
jgi:hypothetical protein